MARPYRTLDSLVDEWYPPGTTSRRRFDYYGRRVRQIHRVESFVYRALIRIPPRWPTDYDEVFGPTNWVGVGPVVAQFWSDILGGFMNRFVFRKTEGDWTLGTIFYNALDGLAWRFMDDEYIPTWKDVRQGKAGRIRWTWRMRRRHTLEMAEAAAEDIRSQS